MRKAKYEEVVPVAVTISDAMLPKYVVPGVMVSPYSSIEIAKDDELLRLCRSNERIEFLIKLVLDVTSSGFVMVRT